jgi:hypothetical protein
VPPKQRPAAAVQRREVRTWPGLPVSGDRRSTDRSVCATKAKIGGGGTAAGGPNVAEIVDQRES